MDHKTLELKATTVVTDQGIFTALAAAYSVDRGNEQIVPGAFKATIAAWQASGKQIPLHWDHMGEPSNIIGSIDPATLKETKDGLYVEGKLALEDSETAREVWRLVKDNSIALSFGYLATEDKREGDVLKLLAIDLFEVSLTPAPMNPDTKILSTKAVSTDTEETEVEDGEDEEPEKAKSGPQDPLRNEIDRLRLEIALGRRL